MNISFIDVDISNDLELIMSWRSNPMIYSNFLVQEGPLVWQNHLDFWYSRVFRKDYIIKYEGRRIGLIGVSEINSVCPEISILIGEVTLWGKGIGGIALHKFLTADYLDGFNYLKAKIKETNQGSLKLFTKLGFEIEDRFLNKSDTWASLKLDYIKFKSTNNEDK